MNEVKFMVSLPETLRLAIKREARRNNVTMNEFIVTVLEQFIEIQRGQRGNIERNGS